MCIPRRLPFPSRLIIATSFALLCCPTSTGFAGSYLLSAHGGSNVSGQGVVRSSLSTLYAPGNCAHCHEQHASIGGSEPAPLKPGPSDYLLFDDLTGNVMCNYCHDGSVAPPADNIASQISKTYSHDPFSPSGLVLCSDCHDAHVARNTSHNEAVDGNSIPATSPLLSVRGTSVSNWTAGNPTAGNENLGTLTLNPLAEPATREYEICFRCHATQPPLATNLDVGLQFNPNNYAVHPVATETNPTWKNNYLANINPGALNAPWAANRNAEMYCSDCHGSETGGDPSGPHGSNNTYMLKLAGPGPSLDNLCLKCHKNPALPGNSSWVDIYNTPLVGDHSLPAHQYSLANNPAGCLACHGDIGIPGIASNIHGANYVGNVNNVVTDTGRQSKAFLINTRLITKSYYKTANGDNPGFRYCAATCHVADGGVGYIY